MLMSYGVGGGGVRKRIDLLQGACYTNEMAVILRRYPFRYFVLLPGRLLLNRDEYSHI